MPLFDGFLFSLLQQVFCNLNLYEEMLESLKKAFSIFVAYNLKQIIVRDIDLQIKCRQQNRENDLFDICTS